MLLHPVLPAMGLEHAQGWKYNGAASGTRGEGKRLEAIRIQLTGQLAQYYDVYYRVHAQTYCFESLSLSACSGDRTITYPFLVTI